MVLQLQFDTCSVNWDTVTDILKTVGMAHYSSTIHQRAFANSSTVIFAFHQEQLVGFGRAISDGVYQAAIYDLAVLPAYQGKGVGKLVLKQLIDRNSGCNFILYASPGKELFYEKLGFRRLKSGLALFLNQDTMQAKGFIE